MSAFELIPIPDWKTKEQRKIDREIELGLRMELTKTQYKKLERAAKTYGVSLEDHVNALIEVGLAKMEGEDLETRLKTRAVISGLKDVLDEVKK